MFFDIGLISCPGAVGQRHCFSLRFVAWQRPTDQSMAHLCRPQHATRLCCWSCNCLGPRWYDTHM